MTALTVAQQEAMLQALQILIDTVKIGGSDGIPGGVMYAALMGKLSLGQFESLMGLACRAGYLRKQGDLYFWIKDMPL